MTKMIDFESTTQVLSVLDRPCGGTYRVQP